MGQSIIEVEGLSQRDPRTHALLLDKVSLQVRRREVLSVMGHDAVAGEALISVLGKVLPRWRGEVTLMGRPLHAWGPELYDRVGVSFARPNQHHWLSVRENLEHWRELYGVRTREVQEVLGWFDLETRIDSRVQDLVDDERQRLSLASSVLHDPEVWMIHTSYPSKRVREVLSSVIKVQRLLGTTVLLATQDLGWAQGVCDRSVVLEEPKIRAKACG